MRDYVRSSSREAWHKLGDMSQREAMDNYLELVGLLDPKWETEDLDLSQLVSLS